MSVYWCFSSHSTIFQLCMRRHRCAGGLKKLDLWSGSQRHRHYVGFFNVPVQAPTRGHPFYAYSENPPHLVTIYDTLGIRRTYSHLKPPGPPRGVLLIKSDLKWCIHLGRSLFFIFQQLNKCHCWWNRESPRAYVAKF